MRPTRWPHLVASILLLLAAASPPARGAISLTGSGSALGGDTGLLPIDTDPSPAPPPPDPNPVPLPNPTPDKEPYIATVGVGGRWMEVDVTTSRTPSVLQRSVGGGPFVTRRTLPLNQTTRILDGDLEPETEHCYRIVEDATPVHTRCRTTFAIAPWPDPARLSGTDRDDDMIDDGLEDSLLQRFAPKLYFHEREHFFPSSVEYYLEAARLTWAPPREMEIGVSGVDYIDPDVVEILPTGSLDDTASLLGQSIGVDLSDVSRSWANPTSRFRTIDDDQPQLSYFRTRLSDADRRAGDLSDARLYGHVHRIRGGRIEIQYWIFYPYNGRPGLATECDLDLSLSSVYDCISNGVNDVAGRLGSHEGDWEHVIVVVSTDDDGWPWIDSVRMSAHGHELELPIGSPALEVIPRRPGHVAAPTPSVERRYGRPVVYVAHHTHALFPKAGKHEVGLWSDFTTLGAVVYGPIGAVAGTLLTAGDAGNPIDDHTTRGPKSFDAAAPGRVLNVGERGALFPGAEFMAFSGTWGPDTDPGLPYLDEAGNSPTTPLSKDGWCGPYWMHACAVRDGLEPIDPEGTSTAGALWVDNFGLEAGGWHSDRHPRFMADVDGDGREDVVGLGSASVFVSRSTGAGFTQPEVWGHDLIYRDGWAVGEHPRMLRDVNGDGLPDLVGFSNSGVEVAINTGSSFAPERRWAEGFARLAGGWDPARHLRLVHDVNGDGMADVIGFGDYVVFVSLSTGTSFEDARVWSYDFAYHDGWRLTAHPRVLADVNGDGLPDIVGFSNYGPEIALNRGTHFESQARTLPSLGHHNGSWRVDRHLRLLRDVDGDGRADVVGFGDRALVVARSNGTGFDAPEVWSDDFVLETGFELGTHPRFVEDIDGDGMADLVAIDDERIWVAYSTGDGFEEPVGLTAGFAPAQGWDGDLNPRVLADADGDLDLELVGFADHGVAVRELVFRDEPDPMPVPEPSPALALPVGALLLGCLARRRRCGEAGRALRASAADRLQVDRSLRRRSRLSSAA